MDVDAVGYVAVGEDANGGEEGMWLMLVRETCTKADENSYLMLLYCSSVTFCNQTTDPFSKFPDVAIWLICVSGEAPCQCSMPGGHLMTSPL
jgi:hypothetical protein